MMDFLVEIQAGKIARVGRVFQPHVNRVRAVVHGGFQSRQVAGGQTSSGMFFMRRFLCVFAALQTESNGKIYI